MANQYTILLQAKINEAGFQTYITGLANKYTLILKGALSGAVAGATATTGGAIGNVTTATTAASTANQKLTYTSQQAQAALIGQANAFKTAGNVTREFTDNAGNLVRVVSNYDNAFGQGIVSTSVWSQKTQALNTTLKTKIGRAHV